MFFYYHKLSTKLLKDLNHTYTMYLYSNLLHVWLILTLGGASKVFNYSISIPTKTPGTPGFIIRQVEKQLVF